jgi:hypothetical protein
MARNFDQTPQIFHIPLQLLTLEMNNLHGFDFPCVCPVRELLMRIQ